MAAIQHQRIDPAPATGRVSALAAWLDPGEPHAVRGPFERWPRITDGALAVVVFGVSLLSVTLSTIDEGEDFTLAAIGDRPAGAFALLAVSAVALWWRRDRAIAVTAVELAIVLAWAFAGYGDGQEVALAVAVYSVGRYTSDHRHSLATVAVVVAGSTLGTIIDDEQRIDILPAIVVMVVAWYLGRRVRNRGDYLVLLRDRAERLEAEQQARARQAVADERARIARELHDVVAHRVSMMTVQAGAAKTIAHDDLDAAVEAMGDVEGAGRQALGELRHLLGVLRPDPAAPDHLGPQPGLADVAALVDELSHTGADVTLTMADLPVDLPAAVDLSAYRIVQESLTNVIKHAGPKPAVEIDVAFADRHLVIDITNTLDAAAPGLPMSGYGIAGMQERAALLSGILTAGVDPTNRYRVHASIPLDSEPA